MLFQSCKICNWYGFLAMKSAVFERFEENVQCLAHRPEPELFGAYVLRFHPHALGGIVGSLHLRLVLHGAEEEYVERVHVEVGIAVYVWLGEEVFRIRHVE